ncbi:hypothetical protein EMIT0P44_20322 [Pseudomonas sp. IT-P44]
MDMERILVGLGAKSNARYGNEEGILMDLIDPPAKVVMIWANESALRTLQRPRSQRPHSSNAPCQAMN